MSKYTYVGPNAGITHPTDGTRLVLISGQSYDLPENSLPSLMSPNRLPTVGRLMLVQEEPTPAEAKTESVEAESTRPAPEPESPKPTVSKRSRRSSGDSPEETTALATI